MTVEGEHHPLLGVLVVWCIMEDNECVQSATTTWDNRFVKVLDTNPQSQQRPNDWFDGHAGVSHCLAMKSIKMLSHHATQPIACLLNPPQHNGRWKQRGSTHGGCYGRHG